jgi:hypothetical protein
VLSYVLISTVSYITLCYALTRTHTYSPLRSTTHNSPLRSTLPYFHLYVWPAEYLRNPPVAWLVARVLAPGDAPEGHNTDWTGSDDGCTAITQFTNEYFAPLYLVLIFITGMVVTFQNCLLLDGWWAHGRFTENFFSVMKMYLCRLFFSHCLILCLCAGKVLSFIHLTKDVYKFFKTHYGFHNIFFI